jgi:hypothetical protein
MQLQAQHGCARHALPVRGERSAASRTTSEQRLGKALRPSARDPGNSLPPELQRAPPPVLTCENCPACRLPTPVSPPPMMVWRPGAAMIAARRGPVREGPSR